MSETFLETRQSARRDGLGRSGGLALVVAGVAMAVYPALRPYSSEEGLDAAQAWSKPAWLAAHLLAMVAFGLMAWALPNLLARARRRQAATTVRVAWLAALVLVLPYYGAETYALNQIGAWAVEAQDGEWSGLGNNIRFEALPVTLFGAGLLVIAAIGLALALALRDDRALRWPAAATGLGLVLFAPQFFGPPWLRIVHGLFLAAALTWLALAAGRRVAR
jgi:hypothetical protein